MSIKIDESYKKYMHGYIEKICNEVGTRSPGSTGERKGAELTAEMMKEFSDDIKMEEFQISPKAFLGWIKIAIPLFIIALISYPWIPILSAICMAVVLVLFAEEFIVYHEILDPIFPKKKSQNTYATIQPTDEVKQTIIYSGHIDSPFEFNFIRWFKSMVYGILVFVAMITILLFALLSFLNVIFIIINLFLNVAWITFLIGVIFQEIWWVILFIGIPVGVLFFFFTTWGDTLGAGDNLSSVSVAMGVGKFLKDAKTTGNFFPKHTKVIIMAFGSEEIGLRGAKAFSKKHKSELLAENTKIINMEVIVEPDSMFIVTKDLNGTVPLSKKVASDVFKVASDLGFSPKYIVTPFGGGSTDSAAIAKEGIETTCIFGMDFTAVIHGKGYFNHYHTIRDTPDLVDPEALQRTLSVCLHYLKMKDEEVS
ncbi:MAG: M28 family metallopeptidase [Candidatus Helarchaeota archaeon]